MNIYVLMKRTFDTEEKIFIKDGQISEEEAEFIINPYDEYAIEEAITLRDEHGGEVTVVTVGNEDSEKQLRTALAMGCDKAVLINIEEDLEEYDEYSTSKVLTQFFKDKQVDLILTGNVTIDGGSGQVGPRLAELMNIPYVTTVTGLQLNNNKVSIVRDIEGDEAHIEAALPLLITAQQGLNEPRYPSLPGIMKAKKKPLTELELDDLDIDEDDVSSKTKTLEIYLPAKKEAGKVLQGELKEQVAELVTYLHRDKKII
ncbi:electron transfer flavoprotein subunit beta/FixA family protein [Metabacillus malikii]|uniref:Electron transfer flavoprotein subunit beta n=1 Tax=Metabacillus malikii TaxID=1504265 RepID=A0ABT9ZGQ0_9BACI|nr:electron transfer flavoprotein subunit beta/FixA family protein [Metabacillus malikii]MDQ0230976.1 electron transfer flavoprotein beta subunit [Metabacillus malikii]